MNKASLNYTLYQMMLEGLCTQTQYQKLISEGFFDKVAGFFGLDLSDVKEYGDDFKSALKDKGNQGILKNSQSDLEKAVQNLYKVAGAANLNPEQAEKLVTNMVRKIAKKSQLSKGGGGKAGNLKSGQALTPDDSSVPKLAAAVGEFAGQDPESAIEQAEEKGLKLDAVMTALAKRVSDEAKLNDPKKAEKIIDYLLKNKYLVVESKLLKISRFDDSSRTLNRWSTLAGLDVVLENDDTTKKPNEKQIGKKPEDIKDAQAQEKKSEKQPDEKSKEKDEQSDKKVSIKGAQRFSQLFSKINKEFGEEMETFEILNVLYALDDTDTFKVKES